MQRELHLPGYLYAVEYPSVPSTMDVAREWVDSCENSSAAAVFVAQDQSAGRGRQGRKWISPPGSALMATFVFPCPTPISSLGGYSLAAGVGILSSLSEFTQKLSLKWPNDIVSSDRGSGYPTQENTKKVGGILIEVIPKGSAHMISLGLGINVQRVPVDLEGEACSLAQVTDEEITVYKVLDLVAKGLLSAHNEFMHGGFSIFNERWCKHSSFMHGEEYSTYLKIDTSSEVIKGYFRGISDVGSLVLQTDAGVREIHSGHILYWGKSHDVEK